MRPIDPLLIGAYEAQLAATQAWLDALTEADLALPSRLPGWRVAELAIHLAGSGGVYRPAIDAPRPPRGTRALSVADYLAGYGPAADEIAAREIAAARDGDLGEIRALLRDSGAEVVACVAGLGEADPVVAARRGPVRASDLLRTRVLELVVHALDVPDGPALDRQAVRVCVRMLAEVLGERYGGKAIEVRVPPYAAVQIGAGVTHTRGTPPNVVECSPEVFLGLATGRRVWEDAVAAGQVRASGSRADLREYLPLL